MNTSNTLMIIDPLKSIEDARNRRAIVVTLRERDILRDGIDFGIVPGSNKPTLLKPGAERLCAAFGFNPQFEVLDKIERWDAEAPLFFYQIVCHLIHIDSGSEVATGVGSCNSMESKYRWRWVDAADVPPHLDKALLTSRSSNVSEFDFAVDKAETGGKYGKPAAYWQAFKDAIADGTARRTKRKTNAGKELDAWEIGGSSYRIPNDDVFSLVNTIVKMACKRALVAAALIGANASEFFTQDIEDMPGFGIVEDNTVEGAFTVVTSQTSFGQDKPSASVSGAGLPTQKPNAPQEPPNPLDWVDEAAAPKNAPMPVGGAANGNSDHALPPNTYYADRLRVTENRAKTATMFLLMTAGGVNIVAKAADLIGLSVNGMFVEALKTGLYPLNPAWTVRAELENDVWRIDAINTGEVAVSS